MNGVAASADSNLRCSASVDGRRRTNSIPKVWVCRRPPASIVAAVGQCAFLFPACVKPARSHRYSRPCPTPISSGPRSSRGQCRESLLRIVLEHLNWGQRPRTHSGTIQRYCQQLKSIPHNPLVPGSNPGGAAQAPGASSSSAELISSCANPT